VLQAKSVELFNLKDDPSEKENLAAKFPDKIKELRKEYDNLAKQALSPKGGPKN
jgi:arylsulfatase A